MKNDSNTNPSAFNMCDVVMSVRQEVGGDVKNF